MSAKYSYSHAGLNMNIDVQMWVTRYIKLSFISIRYVY